MRVTRFERGLWLLSCGSPPYPQGATLFNLLLLYRPVDVSRRPPPGPSEVLLPPDPGPVLCSPPGPPEVLSPPGPGGPVYPAAPPATALISTPRPAPAALKQAGGVLCGAGGERFTVGASARGEIWRGVCGGRSRPSPRVRPPWAGGARCRPPSHMPLFVEEGAAGGLS